jgi:flagellar hook-associated protein 3 FlgL
MTIRFNPDLYAGVLAGLNTNNRDQAIALQELSTGRRVSAPSDDPGATATVIGIHSRSAQLDQFSQSLSTVQGMLQTGDAALGSVITSLTQAISLGVQAGDGILSPADRANVAAQIQSVATQVLGLANTSYQGTYIFAGTKSGAPAYVANPLSPTGVTYQGNASTNHVEVTPGQTEAVNVPGSQIFSSGAADVFAALTNLAQAALTGTAVPAAVAQLRTAFDHVTSQRTFYGSQLQQLDNAQNFLAADKVQLSSQENTTVGIDLAQAATDVQKALTERSALLAAGGKIQTTSLMDYLK